MSVCLSVTLKSKIARGAPQGQRREAARSAAEGGSLLEKVEMSLKSLVWVNGLGQTSGEGFPTIFAESPIRMPP